MEILLLNRSNASQSVRIRRDSIRAQSASARLIEVKVHIFQI